MYLLVLTLFWALGAFNGWTFLFLALLYLLLSD